MNFAPLIGALGSVGSGLITANSIDEQNQLAASQFRENMAFQKYQYEDMKNWQSPKNQVRLLREAGLNPPLALDSKLAGNSLSSVGGVSPTASHAVGDFTALPAAAASLMDSLNSDSLVESEQGRNYAAAARDLQDSIGSSIDNLYKHGNNKLAQYLSRMQAQLVENESAFQMSTFDRRVEEQNFKTALTMTQMESQAITSKYLPEKYQKEFGLLLAQTYAAAASGRLSDRQAEEVLARKIASYGLDKFDSLDLFDESLDLIDSQIESNYGNAFNSFKGDLKSNPFTLNLGGYNAGEVHNERLFRRSRRELRKQLRESRQKNRK